MIEGLKNLLDLQHVDDELLALEREQEAIPTRRSAMADERGAAAERLESAHTSLQEAELAQRGAEGDLQEKEALLAKLEGQQLQVKTNEAYTALLHEMEGTRQAISDCETRILESMDAIESARSDVEAAESGQREVTSRLDAEERSLAAREKELAELIADLRGRREETGARIARELLEQYERVASRRRPAVVTVSKEVCAGCRVDIPPQKYIEVLRSEKIIACGHCQRILVHEEKLRALAAP